MKSLFLKSQGNNPKNRIWEFLIVFREYDYNIKDIAKNSKISYSSAKRLIKDFLKKGIVIQTREIGNAKMYKLDIKSNVVKKFMDFFWAVVDSESELNEGNVEDYASASIGPVSAI
jgi:predicted transcriptional regulator